MNFFQKPVLNWHESRSLLFVQVRMPDIDDQDDPLLVLVPNFVIERIVEHKHVALRPGHELVRNSYSRPSLRPWL